MFAYYGLRCSPMWYWEKYEVAGPIWRNHLFISTSGLQWPTFLTYLPNPQPYFLQSKSSMTCVERSFKGDI